MRDKKKQGNLLDKGNDPAVKYADPKDQIPVSYTHLTLPTKA